MRSLNRSSLFLCVSLGLSGVLACSADSKGPSVLLDGGLGMPATKDASTTSNDHGDATTGSDDDSGLGIGAHDAASSDDASSSDDGSTPTNPPKKGCTTCGACPQTLAVTSAMHVVGTIDYAEKPPVGGNHNECWGTWGVHDTALAVERWVHNLEHGGVVLLYRCDGSCPKDVAEMAKLVTGKTQALLTRYDDMPTTYAIVSWGHRIKSECFDSKAFADFYAANVDHGPESITSDPPGGCPP